MISGPFRISIIFPTGTPHWYWRDEQIKDAYGHPKVRPLFSPSVRDAHKFFQEEAVIRVRDDFRRTFPTYRIFVERIADSSGPHFEDRGVRPQVDSTDRRQTLYVEPDGFEGSGLVFVIRPAVTAAQGKTYCLRSCDVPSLAQFHTALETIYNPDPVECVREAQQRWAQFNPQPFRPAELDARDTAELKQFADQIRKQNQNNSRVRPGSVVDQGER